LGTDTTAEKPIIHVIEDEESINVNVCEIIKVDQSKMGLYMGVFNLSVVLPQAGARHGIGEATRASPNKSLNFFIYTGTLLYSGLTSMFVKE
jgi:hypothetical protein